MVCTSCTSPAFLPWPKVPLSRSLHMYASMYVWPCVCVHGRSHDRVHIHVCHECYVDTRKYLARCEGVGKGREGESRYVPIEWYLETRSIETQTNQVEWSCISTTTISAYPHVSFLAPRSLSVCGTVGDRMWERIRCFFRDDHCAACLRDLFISRMLSLGRTARKVRDRGFLVSTAVTSVALLTFYVVVVVGDEEKGAWKAVFYPTESKGQQQFGQRGIYGVKEAVLSHTTIDCGEQGFPSAQPYLSHRSGG